MRKLFIVLFSLFFMSILFSVDLPADQRSIQVQLRESERPGAPAAGDMTLYNASYALVIGIDAYHNGWPRLSGAVDDAKRVAKALKEKGFYVTFKKNLSSSDLEQVFKEFFIFKGENPQARLFVWFAGHGHTLDGEGFLIPSDAPRPAAGARFKYKALSMRRFGELVRLAKSKHALAVFDSCFSGTIFDTQRTAPPPAVTMATTLPVRQFLSSGDSNQAVSDDGRFRKLFIRAIKGETWADANGDNYLTGSELGLFLTDRLTNLTRTRQTPRYGKLRDEDWDRGDFVFQLAPNRVSVPTTVPDKGRLFVNTDPSGARVRILNIGPRFHQGMELNPGSYNLEVSADRHHTRKEWVELTTGDEKRVQITLTPTDPPKGDTWTDPVTGMEFVWVPGGCFMMGQTEAEKQYLIREAGQETYDKYYKRELPRHRVCVDGFWMGKTEVTRGQFREFVRQTGYKTDAEKKGKAKVFNKDTDWKWKELPGYNWKKVGYSQNDTHPATCISWNDAKAFADWLSRKTGRKIRLPTEAQWEYAARGGTDGMRFWGSEDSDACRYANAADKGHWGGNIFPCDDGYKFTAPAGNYQPNPFGLYDMLGNVWEWCADWYSGGYYSKSPEKNPQGPIGGRYRVLRGGAWVSFPGRVRAANRSWGTPGVRNSSKGFRLVAVPPQ